jgi:hypothetical protein
VVPLRKSHNLVPVREREGIHYRHDECLRASRRHRRESAIEVVGPPRFNGLKLQMQ